MQNQWWLDAACKNSDPDLFAPDTSWPTYIQYAYGKEAIKICDTCPVKDECLMDSLKMGDIRFTIRGGLRPQARFRLAKKLGIVISNPEP